MPDKRRNVLLTLQFDGTNYHGFQVQNNAISVCEVFQNAVEKVFHHRWDVKGCSRTDSGVHAKKFCLSMEFIGNIPADRICRALNQYLPNDIAIISAVYIPLDFHARYDCIAKEYTYYVHNSFTKDPFKPTQSFRFRYPWEIDTAKLAADAKDFVGKKDFAAFCANADEMEDTVRTIYDFTVEREGESVFFKVKGDGFLYNMVRIMVGTLLYISAELLPAGCICDILESKNRLKAGMTAPAKGLFLTDVIYPQGVF